MEARKKDVWLGVTNSKSLAIWFFCCHFAAFISGNNNSTQLKYTHGRLGAEVELTTAMKDFL